MRRVAGRCLACFFFIVTCMEATRSEACVFYGDQFAQNSYLYDLDMYRGRPARGFSVPMPV